MIMGLGMQLVAGPRGWSICWWRAAFASSASTTATSACRSATTHLGVPNLASAALRHTMGLPVASPTGSPSWPRIARR